MVLFLNTQGIQKYFHRHCILIYALDACICLHMVENRKIWHFLENNDMLLCLKNKLYIDGISISC